MTAIPGSIRVTGMIAPSDSTDVYATHDSKYGKGGFKEVTNYTERDAITTERRSEGMLVYVTDTKEYFKIENGNFLLATFGDATAIVNADPIPPSLRMNDYNHDQFMAYLKPIHDLNINIECHAQSYTQEVMAPLDTFYTYDGMVYSPTQNIGYFVPKGHAVRPQWHYINGVTGELVTYSPFVTCVGNAYVGGVFSPTQNRIYFVPYAQSSQSSWHYIDCSIMPDSYISVQVMTYSHVGISVVGSGYAGGVYSPKQDRIYFAPAGQGNQSKWHYIDCNDGTVHEYIHGATCVSYAYQGAIYSPLNDRIYFIPDMQIMQPDLHYIDCSTGNVISYPNTTGIVVGDSYIGGAYSPTQDRIYMSPYNASIDSTWYYIDCATATLVGYPGDPTCTVKGYNGATYSPTTNKIYFIPYTQSAMRTGDTETNKSLHYIDCNTGELKTYKNTLNIIGTGTTFTYSSGLYLPSLNRIYLAPAMAYRQWNYIQEYSSACIQPSVAALTILHSY